MQADVITEVQDDGSTEVIETKHTSNYDMSLERVNGKLPESPSFENLSKLFKPRYVLEVTTEDGTRVPFTYKRVDPMTLLMTTGAPVIYTADTLNSIDTVQSKITELGIGDGTSISGDKMLDLFQDNDVKNTLETANTLRRAVIQAGVISPEITDEIYEELDTDILNALYEAITGGVTSNAELVEHFRKDT